MSASTMLTAREWADATIENVPTHDDSDGPDHRMSANGQGETFWGVFFYLFLR